MWNIITRIRKDSKAESTAAEQREFLEKEVFRAKCRSGYSGTKFKPFKHPCNCCFAQVSRVSVHLKVQGEILDIPTITQALKGQEVNSLNHQKKPGCIFLNIPAGQPNKDTHSPHRNPKQGPSVGGPCPNQSLAHSARDKGASALPLTWHWNGKPESLLK